MCVSEVSMTNIPQRHGIWFDHFSLEEKNVDPVCFYFYFVNINHFLEHSYDYIFSGCAPGCLNTMP